jgi:hypothetical protein
MTTTNSAPDQTSTQTQPTADPMLAVLQAQQAQMDAKLKIQQDQQALLAGALPASTATPNSGAFTVTGARTNSFTGGHLLFTGGAIANFTLFDATGAVKSSGVVVGESRKQEERY